MDSGQVKKQRWQESEKKQEDHAEKRKSQKKEDAGARKGRKVAKHVFFQCLGALEGRKVGSCTPLWREAHFQIKKC